MIGMEQGGQGAGGSQSGLRDAVSGGVLGAYGELGRGWHVIDTVPAWGGGWAAAVRAQSSTP